MDYQPNPTTGLYTQSSVLMALFSLVKCLEENGALKPDQYESKLRATVLQPGADPNRPDFQFVARLADLLDTAGHQPTR